MKVPASIETRIAELEKTVSAYEERISIARQELHILQWACNQILTEGGEVASDDQYLANGALKDRVFAHLVMTGPCTAKAVGAALDEEFHAIGAALGALSRVNKISRTPQGWAVNTR